MQLATRLTGMALAGLAVAAFAATAPAQAEIPAAETTVATESTPELLGAPVRDWCDHIIDYNGAPVYDRASTSGTKTGTFNNGDKVKALCGSEDIVTGDRYSACGGSGTRYLHYTTKASWNITQKSRYVPMSCFINN
jgi:hypothetical protein